MKKTLVIVLAFMLLAAGNVLALKKSPAKKSAEQSGGGGSPLFITAVNDGANAWPGIVHGYVYYQPAELGSDEEAISNIRSSQGYIRLRGEKPYDISVDKYSAVFKIQWTEEKTYQEDVPTTGGFFIGWDYIPTFSNTVQTYHQTQQKNDAMAIQFRDVNAIYFYNNNLCVRTAGGINSLSSDNTGSLKTLADSIYTLAVRNGAKLDDGILFEARKLNEKQCDNLKVESGDMVTSVFAGSEADKAGIKEGDVVLNLADIGAAGGFKKFFAAKKELKIVRFTQDGSVINFKKIRIRMKGAN